MHKHDSETRQAALTAEAHDILADIFAPDPPFVVGTFTFPGVGWDYGTGMGELLGGTWVMYRIPADCVGTDDDLVGIWAIDDEDDRVAHIRAAEASQ